MSTLYDKLCAPFPPDQVSWRVGTMTKDKAKAMALAYIDARDVMDRLDEVCGPAGWQNRYTHADKKTICEIGILTDDGWVWKADGAGESDIEAEKGALSDAFKRAAVRWGIGRYLYHLASPWVELDEWKRIKDSEHGKLRALLTRDAKSNEPQTPAGPSMAVQAASLAIDMCGSTAELSGWLKEHKTMMDKLTDAEYAQLGEVIKAKKAALLPKAAA